MRHVLRALPLVAVAALMLTAVAGAFNPDTRVTIGSPATPFPQNKQNEPAVAINPAVPSIVAAGANDEIDLEACNNRSDVTCPFTLGVGVSGIYFSNDSATTWSQPTYTGLSARNCLGLVGLQPVPADNCDPQPGPIGTLPRYFENNLVSDGDPALAFGPARRANGTFSWDGWRLYYANLTYSIGPSNLKGFEGIAVSRLDSANYARAQAGDSTAWADPVIVSKQNSALFSDHEMLAVDDAASSPQFGNVYICDAAFRGTAEFIGRGNAAPEPIVLNYSSDGGDTWGHTQLSQSVNNGQIGGRQDCAVNTDSTGRVYVFWDGTDPRTRTLAIFMAVSTDGGKHFQRPATVVTHIDQTGLVDPASGDLTFDGVAGARDGTFPTVDIANGAPSGAGATDQILLAWSNGPTPSLANPGPNEQVRILWSRDHGGTWTSGGIASPPADRPDFAAIAISPNGRDAYLTYDNFLQPWLPTTAAPRLFQGVVRHADVDPTSGAIGAWSDLHRAPNGDARGSSANALTGEFLGDYNYVFATNTYAVATWNDARNAADCPAIDAYRQAIVDGTAAGDTSDPNRPAPAQDCPATFGNSDIFGGSYPDPTP